MEENIELAELSDEQRKELQRHHDGESGLLERWKVKKLLARSQAARRYIEHLQEVSQRMQEHHKERLRSWEVDLWDRVERRIEEEERAALLLGKRKLTVSVESDTEQGWSSWGGRLAWGASGACFASFLMFALFGTSSLGGRSPSGENGAFLAEAGSGLQNSSGQEALRTVSFDNLPSSRKGQVEIDWLHSEGTVHLIHSNKRVIPTIWVKRDRASADGTSLKPTRESAPLVINVGGAQ